MTMPWTLEEESCHLLGESQGCFLETVKAGWGILDQPQVASLLTASLLTASLLTAVGYCTVSLPLLPTATHGLSLPQLHRCPSALHILPFTVALLLRGWGMGWGISVPVVLPAKASSGL